MTAVALVTASATDAAPTMPTGIVKVKTTRQGTSTIRTDAVVVVDVVGVAVIVSTVVTIFRDFKHVTGDGGHL